MQSHAFSINAKEGVIVVQVILRAFVGLGNAVPSRASLQKGTHPASYCVASQ